MWVLFTSSIMGEPRRGYFHSPAFTKRAADDFVYFLDKPLERFEKIVAQLAFYEFPQSFEQIHIGTVSRDVIRINACLLSRTVLQACTFSTVQYQGYYRLSRIRSGSLSQQNTNRFGSKVFVICYRKHLFGRIINCFRDIVTLSFWSSGYESSGSTADAAWDTPPQSALRLRRAEPSDLLLYLSYTAGGWFRRRLSAFVGFHFLTKSRT